MLAWMPKHVFSRGKQTHRASTVAQQFDDNASEDRDSRQGTPGLVTDLFLCVKQHGFFSCQSPWWWVWPSPLGQHWARFYKAHLGRFTITAMYHRNQRRQAIDTLNCRKSLSSHLRYKKKSISSSDRPSELLITGKNVSCQMLSRQLQNRSQSYFCQGN